jgi:CRP-like cAMP-binding protein
LFAEGDEGDHLYVIAEGKLKLGTSSGDGRENLLSILGPGEMFGELSLFDPGPRTSTATAVTDAKLLSLGQEKLIPWLATNPNVSLQLLARLAQRLRRTNEAVGDLVFSDVPGRVAKALIDLGERFGKQTAEGLFVHHDLTQEELAQLVGASRETVNKALADFAGRNWLKLDGRAVLITDLDRLSKRGK